MAKMSGASPCKQNGAARTSAEAGEQFLHRLKRLAFAEYSFGQTNAGSAGMVKKNAVIHDSSGVSLSSQSLPEWFESLPSKRSAPENICRQDTLFRLAVSAPPPEFDAATELRRHRMGGVAAADWPDRLHWAFHERNALGRKLIDRTAGQDFLTEHLRWEGQCRGRLLSAACGFNRRMEPSGD